MSKFEKFRNSDVFEILLIWNIIVLGPKITNHLELLVFEFIFFEISQK